MGRRWLRFAARVALLAACWWLPWAHAFARGDIVFDRLDFLKPVPALIALAQGLLASFVLSRIERKHRRELDLLWFVRTRPAYDLLPPREGGDVDRRVACPWCAGVALTRLSKATLGPAVTAPCASCGKPVSVSAKPLVVVAVGCAFALGMWSLPAFSGVWLPSLGLVPIAISVAAAFVLNDRLPLVKR